MRPRLRYARMTSGPGEWSRAQAQGVLALIGIVVVLLLSGTVLAFRHGHAIGRSAPTPDSPAADRTPPSSLEDRIADSPFPQEPAELARSGELSAERVGAVLVPLATQLGSAGVPTGFPRTVGGAVGQLAAIDRTALGSASIGRSQEVIEAWAAPGGPTAETWSGVQAMTTLLTAAGLPPDAAGDIDLAVVPTMALVKGQLGAGDEIEFVVPCIQMVITATYGGSVHRTAVADCQRMVWQTGRWIIGPGPEPAPVPSLWPGSPAAYDLGFEWIKDSTQ